MLMQSRTDLIRRFGPLYYPTDPTIRQSPYRSRTVKIGRKSGGFDTKTQSQLISGAVGPVV